MPRPGPRRQPVQVKLSDEAIDELDRRREKFGRNRSEQVRVMLRFSAEHMPDDYAPDRAEDFATRGDPWLKNE